MWVDEATLHGRTAFAGLDLASTTDIAALAYVLPRDDDGYDAIWRFFVARAQIEDLDRRTAGAASAWAREGWLTVNDGDVIDYQSILGHDRPGHHPTGA